MPVYKWQKISQITVNFVTLYIFMELLKKSDILGSLKKLSRNESKLSFS